MPANHAESSMKRILRAEFFHNRRWAKALLLVGFWTLVGCIYITSSTVIYLTVGAEQPYTIGRAVWTLLGWYTWIPTSLIVLWLVRRFPLERQTGFRYVGLHLLAAPLLSLFASILYTSMRMSYVAMGGAPGIIGDAAFWEVVSRVFLGSVTIDSVIYMTILVGVHAFEYYRRYREGALRAEQLKAELAEAQLHALSLQLRPHFLFNTFHTIAMLVREHEEDQATETIANLSAFLRYVLDSDGMQEVPLEKELEFLRSYVAVEKARFEDRINVRIQANDEARQALVPNLLLQPLVENAVRHGLRANGDAGTIEVDARREGDQMRLRVRDTGPGLPGDWSFEGNRGIGLTNTRARLERLYGENFHLTLTNGEDGGLLVTAVIPYARAAVDADRRAVPMKNGQVRA